MKKSCIIISVFFLVGCENLRQNASLTAEQARILAIRLANDKASAVYHCQPFQGGEPAHFMEDHWVWTDTRGVGHEDIQARVDLATDGSTNEVDVKLLDSKNLFSRRQF